MRKVNKILCKTRKYKIACMLKDHLHKTFCKFTICPYAQKRDLNQGSAKPQTI